MKNFKIGFVSFLFLVICLAASTNNAYAQYDESPGLDTLTPIFISGNPSCATLNASQNPAFEHITSSNQLKLDFQPPEGNSNYPFTSGNGRELIGTAYPDKRVYLYDVNAAATEFSFLSDLEIAAVIVKAGRGSNVFAFSGGTTGVKDLFTPGKRAAISHISFCFVDEKK